MRLIFQLLLIANCLMIFGSTLVSASPLAVGFSKKEIKISTNFFNPFVTSVVCIPNILAISDDERGTPLFLHATNMQAALILSLTIPLVNTPFIFL